jgi:hypothetical protein
MPVDEGAGIDRQCRSVDRRQIIKEGDAKVIFSGEAPQDLALRVEQVTPARSPIRDAQDLLGTDLDPGSDGLRIAPVQDAAIEQLEPVHSVDPGDPSGAEYRECLVVTGGSGDRLHI